MAMRWQYQAKVVSEPKRDNINWKTAFATTYPLQTGSMYEKRWNCHKSSRNRKIIPDISHFKLFISQCIVRSLLRNCIELYLSMNHNAKGLRKKWRQRMTKMWVYNLIGIKRRDLFMAFYWMVNISILKWIERALRMSNCFKNWMFHYSLVSIPNIGISHSANCAFRNACLIGMKCNIFHWQTPISDCIPINSIFLFIFLGDVL